MALSDDKTSTMGGAEHRGCCGAAIVAFRLRHRTRAVAESTVTLELIGEGHNDVYERPNYLNFALGVIIADVRQVDLSSRIQALGWPDGLGDLFEFNSCGL